MRTLRELEAVFQKHYKGIADQYLGRKMPDGTTQWGGFETTYLKTVETLAEADSIRFLCPKCFEANSGKVGTHSVHVSFEGRGVSKEDDPNPRWKIDGGSTLDDLRVSPSIQLLGGCNWHGYVGHGNIPPGHAGDC